MVYIFDLDGTLLDTLADLAVSANYALRENGFPERSVEEVRRFVGNGVRKLIERAVPSGTPYDEVEKTLATFKCHYTEHNLDTTKPYPGIVSMLKRLKDDGCQVAVVSNKFDAATKALCAHFFSGLVDVAIGESEKIRKKPAPDTVFEAMRILQAEPRQCVFVGDSDVDIQTARNAGIPCVSVLWGFRDKQFLIEHGATRFAVAPGDVISS